MSRQKLPPKQKITINETINDPTSAFGALGDHKRSLTVANYNYEQSDEYVDVESEVDHPVVPTGRLNPLSSAVDKVPGRQNVILTPTYRTFSLRNDRLLKDKRHLVLECLADTAYERRHRPIELAEVRTRKREVELERYQRYITRLKKESPELWSKKASF